MDGSEVSAAAGSASPENVVHAFTFTAGAEVGMRLLNTSGGTGERACDLLAADGQTAAKLPEGIKFGSDCSLSGTLAAITEKSSRYEYQVRVRYQDGGVVDESMVLVVNPPIRMDVSNVQVTAGGRLDAPLQVVRVSGGSGAIRASLFESDGKTPAILPEGLRFNEINGTLEGKIPLVAMEKKCVIKAVDQGGGSIERAFTLKVNAR
ncbi:hypothetical protein [Streptomyces sp. NPDC001903]|uniref:hypothetical protein n=1 Tax=Streptomyces sp. NPDC001903 TaxID=3364622 RepID=UPI00369D1224